MSRMALVVDDSASMRSMVASSLKAQGFGIAEAAHGQEALMRVAGMARIDVIVCDLNMPIMDGITFLQKLRAIPARKHTPVLLLTTETRGEVKDRARQAGATGWLTKPFDPVALRAVVARVVP